MSRCENEDTSELDLPSPEVTTLSFYDKNFHSCDEKTAVTKIATTRRSNQEASDKFYIRFSRGELVDPHQIDYNVNLKNFSFKKVNKQTFEYYTKYLETKNRLYFTRSRRSYME